VTLFRAQTARVAAVLVAEGLELLDEERVVNVLRRLATEQGTTLPSMLLVHADSAAPEKSAAFDGAIQRTAVAEDFLSAVAQWLPKEAPCTTA
jgi:hypothetical protein